MITLFQFTSLLITQLKTEKLFAMCNIEKDVFAAVNKAYCALILRYMTSYIEIKGNINDINALNKA